MERREILSNEFYWEEEGSLIFGSYVVGSATKKKKNVILLTTMKPLLGVTVDDGKCKPAIYKLYDFTKGRTDIVDQRIGFFTTKVKSRRWSMAALAYIIDTARVNASTLYAFNTNVCPLKVDSFEFGMGIVFDLVKPFIQRRNTARLPPMVTSKISLVLKMLGENIVNTIATINECVGPALGEKRKRCKICIGNLLASDNNQNKIASIYQILAPSLW